MGRGYSASRSKSGRPTLRIKRSRSLSLHALKRSIDAEQSSSSTATAEKSVEPRRVLKVPRQRRGPSAKQDTVKPAANAAAAAAPHSTRAESRGRGGDVGAVKSGSSAPRRRSQSTDFRRHLAALETEYDDAMEASEDEEETVMSPMVMTKYKECGRVVDAVLESIAAACIPGADTKTLCEAADAEVATRLKTLFVKTKNEQGQRLPRGLSYPANISVNEMLCNDAPFAAEHSETLKEGDVVKLHIGCHLDGYPVSAARTLVVMPTVSASPAAGAREEDEEEEARQRLGRGLSSSTATSATPADAIEAARVALLGMIHLLRPGTLNADVTDFIATVGHHYGVQAVEGVLSNRTKRWVPDGIDAIIARRVSMEDPHQDVADCEMRPCQVWSLDVAFTTSPQYRIHLAEKPATLYRCTPAAYSEDARVKQANDTLREALESHFCFPFHFKSLSTPLKAKLGINVLAKKGVMDVLPCLRTKRGFITTRFSATVAISGKRITVLCGAPPAAALPLPPSMQASASSLQLPESIADVIARPLQFRDARAVVTAAVDLTSGRVAKQKRVELTSNEE